MNELLRERFRQQITPQLSDEDDSNFWMTAFDTLLSDIDALYPYKSKKHEVFLQIGACSHWLRPHQHRWTASGGFAWPEGYLQRYQDHIKNSWGPIGSGLPELEWFVLVESSRQGMADGCTKVLWQKEAGLPRSFTHTNRATPPSGHTYYLDTGIT